LPLGLDGKDGSSPNGSVLSLPVAEVKEDSKILELQQKVSRGAILDRKKVTNKGLLKQLNDMSTEVLSKNDTIETLLAKAKASESSLKTVRLSLEQAKSSLRVAQDTIRQSEKERSEWDERYAALYTEHVRVQSDLKATHRELEDLKETSTVQEQLVQNLRSRLEASETAVHDAKESLNDLKKTFSEELAARNAQLDTEHAARLQVEADMRAVQVRNSDLEAAHGRVQNEVESRADDLERLASRIEGLVSKVALLRSQKEEQSVLISKLEAQLMSETQSRTEAELARSLALNSGRDLEGRITAMVITMEHTAEVAENQEHEPKQMTKAVITAAEEVPQLKYTEEHLRQVDKLKQEREYAFEQIMTLQAEKEQLTSLLRSELATADAERTALQETNTALRRRLEEISRAQAAGHTGCMIQ